MAEKLRAVLQSRVRLEARGWGASRVCRDYYDLWCILYKSELQKSLLPDLVSRKCFQKGVKFESFEDFFVPDLLKVARTEWNAQLRPFVPNSPDVEKVLHDLPVLVENLDLCNRSRMDNEL